MPVKNETRIECERFQVDKTDEYDFKVDMSDYAHPEALKLRKNYSYRLVASVNHSGDIGFGHYTAICKRPVFEVL